MRRFFIAGELADTVTITGPDARHIGRVLRLGPGAEIVVADKAGHAARAVITAVEAASVQAAVRERLAAEHEPPVAVTLAQGLPKGDKLEYIVQKAVELGAAAVWPLACENCTVRYDAAKQVSRRERWQKIAAEAAKQCGRDVVPAVAPVRPLADALAEAGADTEIIMLYEGQGGEPLRAILAGGGASSYLLLVGPEGGFSLEEVALCRERGARVATLGPRVLRTETASLAALAIVMYEKGDLG
ncbi:16S rRNA (uracil(1498)-N(3))-methyltransferase [Anaeroselena agilis]|uniref:Ribosomal RNA small subunit methyltransferase E n=1 Tax=Anaeroselena agilis TaxID=3063788 RepID=A0ABU3NYU6_9FIRM|nr:16S rRNA (uracil(1498)-N(3))-methyltransferase [Selenomonadales bacterium 4137-cl]